MSKNTSFGPEYQLVACLYTFPKDLLQTFLRLFYGKPYKIVSQTSIYTYQVYVLVQKVEYMQRGGAGICIQL